MRKAITKALMASLAPKTLRTIRSLRSPAKRLIRVPKVKIKLERASDIVRQYTG
jgi:hypothetical protein